MGLKYATCNQLQDLKMKREHKISSECDYELAPEDFFTERAALAVSKDMQWITAFNEQ